MRISIKTLFRPLALLVSLTGCLFPIDRAYRADPRLPQPLNEIWLSTQRNNAKLADFQRAIRDQYGDPTSTNDSKQQWEIDGGILSIDRIAGASFVTKNGELVRMFNVQYPMSDTVYGSYEMVSHPAADYGHERCWLGNVELRVNGTYRFTDSGAFLAQRRDQASNFFMTNPSGEFELTYLDNVGPTTLVESVHADRRVAKLRFLSPQGGEKTYLLKVMIRGVSRHLAFDADAMEFEMHSNSF